MNSLTAVTGTQEQSNHLAPLCTMAKVRARPALLVPAPAAVLASSFQASGRRIYPLCTYLVLNQG